MENGLFPEYTNLIIYLYIWKSSLCLQASTSNLHQSYAPVTGTADLRTVSFLSNVSSLSSFKLTYFVLDFFAEVPSNIYYNASFQCLL